MIEYIGHGNDKRVEEVAFHHPPVDHPFPFKYFTCWFKPVKIDEGFVRRCKWSTYIFAIIKFSASALAFLLYFSCFMQQDQKNFQQYFMPREGVAAATLNTTIKETTGRCRYFEPDDMSLQTAKIYIAFIVNLSVTYAFYMLVLFYLGMHDPLSHHSVTGKFITVKLVVFVSFWQNVVISFLLHYNIIIHDGKDYNREQIGTGFENATLMVEMFLIALAHWFVFSYKPYTSENYAFVDEELINSEREGDESIDGSATKI